MLNKDSLENAETVIRTEIEQLLREVLFVLRLPDVKEHEEQRNAIARKLSMSVQDIIKVSTWIICYFIFVDNAPCT